MGDTIKMSYVLLADRSLSPASKLLYSLIWNMQPCGEYIELSIDLMCRCTGLSERTLHRSMEILIARSFILRKKSVCGRLYRAAKS